MSEAERVLVTSALPYIHGMPHLGNIVSSVLPADVYYRFQRLKGRDSVYICASDAHGTMYEVEAAKQGRETADLVYENHEQIQKLFERLHLDFSYYGTTDSDTNREITNYVFNRLDENGYLEEHEIELPYCRNCEKFLADRWIEGKCPECGGLARGDQCDDCGTLLEPKDLIEPYCVHCGEKQIEFRPSKHLFFQLQEFEEWLRDWLDDRPANTLTESQTLSWLNEGLEERCISRDANWGFDIPREGFGGKKYYVWFDAVLEYIGATKEWAEENSGNWKEWWQNDENVKYVQFMGKDNIPFHTIIFPSMLKGTGEDWTMADDIMASGFLLAKDVKFSKSRGKGLNLESALKVRSSDYWRYILMALYPRNDDTTFSWNVFRNRINNELTNSFGNYVHRVLKFIKDNSDGEIPEVELDKESKNISKEINERVEKLEDDLENFRFDQAISKVIGLSSFGNRYFQKREPWETIKTDKEACKRTLFVCANIVKSLAIVCEPFLPRTAEKIWNFLDMDGDIHREDWERAKEFELGGKKIGEPEPLFEKISDEEIKNIKNKFEQSKESDEKEGGEKSMISFNEFQELDLRIGKIKEVEPIEGSDKLFKMEIDVGDETKQSVGGFKNYYTPEELEGKRVPVLVNLESSELMGVKSECMVLAAVLDEDEPVLLNPERDLEPGTKIM